MSMKLQVIKAVREQFNMSQREALTLVDDMMKEDKIIGPRDLFAATVLQHRLRYVGPGDDVEVAWSVADRMMEKRSPEEKS